jgi:hypothetical protein
LPAVRDEDIIRGDARLTCVAHLAPEEAARREVEIGGVVDNARGLATKLGSWSIS